MKKLFCIFGLLLAAFSSEAAFISFTATNSYGAPDTNYLVLIPVSTVASGDGSFTTTGLPRRIYPDVSGVVVTNLMQNNWQVTNRFVNYVIRTPLDSGPTIYPAGQLLISSDSTGIGVFVTQQITYGGSNGIITLNQITNGLGYLPLAQTNLPSLTNGFISLLEATNVSTAFANGSSNLLYSDYTTKLAIQSALTSTTSNALYADIQIINALGLTNAFATNAAGVSYANGRIYVSTNYDALGAAATAQLQAAITATNIATNFVFNGTNGFTSVVYSNAALFAGTNLVAITSNGLAGAITTSAANSAVTATNIATNQVFLATNGMMSIVYSNAALFTGTNLLFATSNALAGQIGAAGVSAVTATNISTNQVFLGTNNIGITSGLAAMVPTNRFDVSGSAATNRAAINPMLAPYNAAGNGVTDDTAAITNALKDSALLHLPVILPSRTFFVTPFIIRSNQTLHGSPGSKLLFSSTNTVAGGLGLVTMQETEPNQELSGVEIDGGNPDTIPVSDDGRIGLYIWNVQQPSWNVHDVYVHGFGVNIQTHGGAINTSPRATIRDLYSNYGWKGFNLLPPAEYVTFTGLHANYNHYGVWLEAGNSQFSSCDFSRNDINLGVGDSLNSEHSDFVACAFNHANTKAVVGTNVLLGLTFVGCEILPPTLYFTNAHNIVISSSLVGWSSDTTATFINSTNCHIVNCENPYFDFNPSGYTFTATGCSNVTRDAFIGDGSGLTNLPALGVAYPNAITNNEARLAVFKTGLQLTNAPLILQDSNLTQLIGSEAGANAVAVRSVVIGSQAARDATNAQNIVAIGPTAGLTAINAQGLIAIGDQAGEYSTNAVATTAIGYQSLQRSANASNNVAIGYQSLHFGTNAHDNVIIGAMAMGGNDVGNASSNIIIGAHLDIKGNGNIAIDSAGNALPLLFGNSITRTMTNNGSFYSSNFFGDGAGLTNTSATNLSQTALTQVTNITQFEIGVLSISASTGTNIASALIGLSNAPIVATNLTLAANKLNRTNDIGYGLTFTNTAFLGDVSFGRDGLSTNITSRTNFIAFNGAGSSIATNGAMLWSVALGVYTNFLTGAILTNNSTAWLLQTNGVTLYNIAGANPVGAYSAVSGVAPAPTAVYTAELNDHMILSGYFSVSNFNQMFTNIFTNITATTTNSFIANSGGLGTNITITNLTVASPGAPFINVVNNGLAINFAAMSGGLASTNTGSGNGSAILSGATNRILTSGSSVIAGGMWNVISGGNNYNVIGGGLSNTVGTAEDIFVGGGIGNSARSTASALVGGGYNGIPGSSPYSSIVGGAYNTNGSSYGSIVGGLSNLVQSSFSYALGKSAAATSDNTLVWSGATSASSTTNSQATFSGTNGIYLNGPMWLNAMNTNGGIYILSNQFSLYAVTNAMPNFASWIGSSNGVPVRIYNNAGTPVMTLMP